MIHRCLLGHHWRRFPEWDFVLIGYGRFPPRNILGAEIIFPLGGNIVERDSAVMRRTPRGEPPSS